MVPDTVWFINWNTRSESLIMQLMEKLLFLSHLADNKVTQKVTNKNKLTQFIDLISWTFGGTAADFPTVCFCSSAVAVGALHAVGRSHARGGAPALPDAGVWSRKFRRRFNVCVLSLMERKSPADQIKGTLVSFFFIFIFKLLCVCRLNGSPAATPCPTRTWTRAACATTPACVSAATLFPAAEFTPATSSRSPSGRSATATRTVCCLCGREKVRRRPLLHLFVLFIYIDSFPRSSLTTWILFLPQHQS